MADNFNINLDPRMAQEAAGLDPNNPDMTSVDFANQIARNQQAQQQQEAMIQQAQALAKQRTLEAGQKQSAADLGVNPEMKDFFTVDEAVAYLKAAGIDDGQIQSFVSSLNGKPIVSRFAVDTIIRKKELQAKSGTPFIASDTDAKNDSLVTKEGDNLISGQSYYDTGEKDDDGNAIYAHGGKEPTDAASVTLGEKQKQFSQRQFNQIVAKINPYLASSRNAVGVAMQSYARCARAIDALSKENVSKQQAINIVSEIGAVFKGGSPDQAMLLQTEYNTLYGNVMAKLGGITGRVFNSLPNDVKNYMMGAIRDLEAQSRQVIENAVSVTEAANQETIQDHQKAWDDMKTAIDKGLSSPDAAQKLAGDALPAMDVNNAPEGTSQTQTGQPDIHALAAALGLKKKAE